ncbi:DUF4157 domain-containing protein [Streptomyces sp. DH24]|uniref:eCIS core domain-containing protein n=1 Tax=Streptomyces sp. DH24 TaxID=3040123 RepID=UPI0024436599|nr:DUF4157 domain-containing protein [Streptomyces sp. DH24]MDG9715538.1 DUF4157 domain-containing protein [Streptomyces sp. DH24]
MSSRTDQNHADQSAEQRRRKRRERAAKSRAPEPKNIVSGAGQPLDPGVRRELEEQLGHDLGGVRLHTDRDAGQLTDLLGADAVAVGQDIFFREGAYKPGTDEGRRLLAHELLHTVQNPHGLGALRAGRDLGAVSLPQQAVEREAESAAQDLVRAEPDAAAEVEERQATPGWLRYATVDADRRRMEQLDPATLVDRLANGLLRSLRGDPEDRSGRVRLQLARMAPQVQDSVLDRLEVRLPAPALDHLLELVEETQEAGPLPLDAAAAPHAVAGAGEEIEEEREAAQDRTGEPSTGRDRREGGTEGDKDRKGTDEGPRGERSEGEGGSGDTRRDTGAEAGPRETRDTDRQQHSQAQQERAQERQEERDGSGREAQQDAVEERKGEQEGRQAQQDQDAQDEAGDPQEADQQGSEQEQRGPQDEADAGRRPAQALEAVDRSGAEPGERSRTASGPTASRVPGDPENEQDADDEPLGLEAEPAEEDVEHEPGDEAAGGRASDADTAPSGEGIADDPRLFVRRKRGAPRPPALSLSGGSTDDAGDVAEAEPGASSSERTDDEDVEDRAVPELWDVMAADPDSAGDGADSAAEPLSSGPVGASLPVTGKDAEREQEQARQEDAEAARREAEARAADGAGPVTLPGPGETAGPDQLAKADEDARRQSVGSASGSKGAADGGSGRAAESDAPGGGRTEAGAGKAADQRAGEGADQSSRGAGQGRDGSGTAPGKDDASQNEDDAGSGPSTPAPGDREVSEGKGPATTPGPRTGRDRVSVPGPTSAPGLAPGNGPSPMSAGPEPKTDGPRPTEATGSGGAGGTKSRPTPKARQAARRATRNARRGVGGGGRTASAPAPVRSGGRGGGRAAGSGPAKAKREAPAPDVSHATPETGLATASGLKPHQALETLKGVDGAVGRSVDEERSALRKAPPKTQRPSGSPRTVPGGPRPAAPGTYTNAKVARTEAAPGKTPEITGEQKPEGEVPGANVPEPSWWDIAVTIGAQLFGKLLKEILPLDDLIDSILGLPTKDEGLKNAKVGDAPRLPLENDSDPQRTDEQGQKLDERKNELHRSGREDAARPMGEDQIYPDVPKETLTGKVAGGKKNAGAGGTKSVSGGGVPIESASAVAEHDRGPQIQAGFAQGRQKMAQERQAKDKKAAQDRDKHDQDLRREVSASGRKQADARDKGRSDIADSRDEWRKEQDDKVAEIDGKKGKKYDEVRKDIKDKDEQTEKDVDKRTEDDNKKIEDEDTKAEREAEKKQEEGKSDADNWLEEAIEKLKQFFEDLKNAIKTVFEKARQVVTDLIDRFKQQVFKLIDDARNWVIDKINKFADVLIALGDELLADYPAMRDKWRDTIDGARDWAVQKVNEAANALKEVAGRLLDGLCGALLAGLDMLEGGLLAAVDIAETVTVGALEFGAAAVAALGEWAAIFNDIVSDPGDWISKAGAAAETGAKEHLFDEIKTAVKAWFNQKVQEIIGIPVEDFQELISGGVTVEQMAQMAWDEALPQLPVIIGVMVVEKVVAKLIPGAGWVMAIIDALQTAWGALSEILAAFGLFMDFLKSVKSGNGALPFAKAVAAGVVALLELVYEFLIEGVSRFMGKVAERLGDMLKGLRRKKETPGGDAPDRPSAPDKPAHDKPKDDERTDKPADRPAPRKPSPDRASRPASRPRPGKRPSPGKKPRPGHTTRAKKRRDDDERREEGREVNAARRRARDAERRTRDEDRDTYPTRRGPARDTLRPDRGRPGRDRADDRDRDPRDTRPGDRRGPQDGRRSDDRRTDGDHKDDRRRDRDRDGDKDREKRERPGNRVRRARQTVKAAARRARRAARKLHGKARRRLGSRLNDRLRRLRDRWRRRRDRLRDDHSRRRTGRNRPHQRERDTSDITLPKVRFADADDGERHTLMFHGQGARAPLYIHSTPVEIPPFLDSWAGDLGKPEAKRRKSEQQGFLTRARVKYADVLKEQARPLMETDEKKRKKEKRDKERDLKKAMMRFADEARNRIYFDIPKEDLQDFTDVSPVDDEDTRRSEEHMSGYIGNPTKTLFGGGGQDARKAADGQPPGWEDIAERGLSAKGAWVRMHLLPESLGGHAKGNNLVPARGETNKEFYRKFEGPAYHAVPDPEPIIWYRTRAEFHQKTPHVASYIYAEYGGYEKIGGTGKEQKDWKRIEQPRDKFDRSPLPLDSGDMKKLSINGAGRPAIKKRLLGNRYEALAKHFVDARNELHNDEESLSDVGDIEVLMDNYKRDHPTLRLTGLDVLLAALREKEREINWKWEF